MVPDEEPDGPAGTLDRPPLPVADLDARAWAVLRWRQDHLPLGRRRARSGPVNRSSVFVAHLVDLPPVDLLTGYRG